MMEIQLVEFIKQLTGITPQPATKTEIQFDSILYSITQERSHMGSINTERNDIQNITLSLDYIATNYDAESVRIRDLLYKTFNHSARVAKAIDGIMSSNCTYSTTGTNNMYMFHFNIKLLYNSH